MKTTVVVGYDRTLAGGRALLEAGREAACRGADVTVIHVFDPGSQTRGHDTTVADAREIAATVAAFGAGVLRHRYPALTVRDVTLEGVPQEVLAMASRGAKLLVLGSGHEDGLTAQPLGPVAEWTVAHTSCPVMVVRGVERYPKGVVLAAIDVEERADEVVNFAFAEARYHSARLQAVGAVDPSRVPASVGAAEAAPGPPGPPRPYGSPPQRAEAETALGRILGDHRERGARVHATGEIIDGPPASVLTSAAAHADVVVTGARRRDGERSGVRIGPVADALLCGVVCPVIVVPHC